MKRYLAVVLLLSVLLALIGCGSNEVSPAIAELTKVAESVAAEEIVEAKEETAAPAEVPTSTETTEITEEPEPDNTASPAASYVLNTNTKKFHYPHCNSVSDMKETNRKDVTMTRDEIIAMGYKACKRCNP